MACLDSEQNMLEKCRSFATLLSIDDELKVAGDDDAERDSIDDGLDDDVGSVNGGKPMKRKGSHSGGLTPKRPRNRSRNGANEKQISSEPEEAVFFD